VVVCFDFAKVSVDARLAASFEGVCDGEECVAVNVVTVGGWAAHVALYKAEVARTVCKEVGVAYLEVYVDAR
jgi:hypothetical protein